MPTPTNILLLASAARTADVNTDDQYNYAGHKGVQIIIDATAITSSPSVVFTIQGKDPQSGKYYTILASAAVTGISTTILRVYPGLDETTNTDENDNLPLVWRVNCNHDDVDSITYSVAANLLP